MSWNKSPSHRWTFTRAALGCLSFTLLASCRLVVTTDSTGHIESASGQYDCVQASCAYSIEEEVSETFTAVPADSFRFVRWEGLCMLAPTAVCEARMFPLPEQLSHHDGDIGLSAVFEPVSTVRTWYRDRDGDNYGAANQRRTSADQPRGFVINKQDCDDYDADIRPFAKEREDGKDNNCNGMIDEGFVDIRFFADRDGDGFGDPDSSRLEKRKPKGYVTNQLDCNDGSARDFPDANELADGRDNDCDGDVDEGGSTWYRDVDGDGFGLTTDSTRSLQAPDGYASTDGDCDDNNAAINPDAEETFDSVDNDCDGSVDEGFTEREYFRDTDNDGYGDASDSVVDVVQPQGYATRSGDNCPSGYNPTQSDADGDGLGDACDGFTDSDEDGIEDSSDNCPSAANQSQEDGDNDGLGDACEPVDNTPSPPPACMSSPDAQAMLDAVNAFRSQSRTCGARGTFPAVGALSWNCQLETAAFNHSRDMANNNFFSHSGSDGSSAGDRATRAGYSWWTWGENIAAGYPSVSTVMQGWIDSDGHCANMMNANFSNLGAARFVDSGSTYGTYWTQVFGSSR